MEESEVLKRMEKSAWEDVKYSSNSNKEERERWVVSEFLSVLGIDHHGSELHSLEQQSKIDVCFRNAQFQVKELPDPNLLRTKMYKDAWKSIKAAESLDAVSLVGDVRDIPPVVSIFDLVLNKARKLAISETYKESKGKLDLLIYVTRSRASLVQENEIKSEMFSELGWRSVSFVNAKQAVVLFSSQSAPKFIIAKSQKLMRNNG